MRRGVERNREGVSKLGRGFSILAWAVSLVLVLAVTSSLLRAQKPPPGPDVAETGVNTQTPQTPSPLVPADLENNMSELKPLEDNIEAGRYQETIPGLKSYLQAYPRSAEGHYDLGYVYFRTHDISGAVRELSKSLQLNVKNAQAHKILGLVCTFVGRYDLAETELQAAAKLEPDSAEIHYWLGRIYYTRQVFPLAEKEFKAAIRLDPTYMKAYNNLGLVMEVFEKNDEAVKDYQTAARLDEEQNQHSPWPYEYLSAYYNRRRQPDQAIEQARKAITIDPRCDIAHFDLAKAYQIQKDWAKVEVETQKAIAINSSTPEYFYLLSIALRRLGKIPESEAALKRFQQIHKNRNATAKLWRNANEAGASGHSKTSSAPTAHEPY